MKEKMKKYLEKVLLVITMLIIGFMVGHVVTNPLMFQQNNTDTVTYEKAVVVQVIEQELRLEDKNQEFLTGFQKLLIRTFKNNEEIVLDNYVTITHNIVAKEGMKIILCADHPEGISPYYTIYNYDRSNMVWAILLLYLLVIISVGRFKGIRSAIGLAFTLAITGCYMIPALYNGKAIILSIVITVLSAITVSCFCISGLERKTCCYIVSTLAGTIVSGVIFVICSYILNLNGGAMEESETLFLVSQSTEMNLYSVMFSGILIASLGAIMDVAVSIGAALHEVKANNPMIKRTELFWSGMTIGRDMIGTMTNTLILAFMGGTLPMLIVYLSYGVQYHQFLSSDFLALEFAQGISGSIAVILTVPISAFICSAMYSKKKEEEGK